MRNDSDDDAWWSEQGIAPDSGRLWRLGPLNLFVHRLDGEWQVGHDRLDWDEPIPDGWAVEPASEIPSRIATVERFATGHTGDVASLVPRPADRSVVARPHTPLRVLAGEETRVYVSSPVWVEVRVGRSGRGLLEVPTRRLSDTWFGPSTREGEVAYALKTHAGTRLVEVPRPAYRCITPVRIRNRAAKPLLLERMNLPVPYLSLYQGDHNELWTEAVTLERRESNEMASLEVAKGAPREAGAASRLSEPRMTASESLLVRAFSGLLRPFDEED